MVQLYSADIHLIVEATGNRTVIVNTMAMRLESYEVPPHVSDVGLPLLGYPMDPRELREFRVRLTAGIRANTTAPTSWVRPAEGVPDFPYTVTLDSPDHFFPDVGTAEPGDYRFRIEVHWICQGQSGIVVADQSGEPFRFVRPER
ncbi:MULTISPECIES: hypothetical protein [unclassified Streptomyces]|uniref:hypothetical protein n=1 Tax=unclassified Streptomyces TaxID=2593676 RepID=UPI0033DEB5EB